MGFNPNEVKYEAGQAPVYLPHSTNDEGKLVYDPKGVVFLKVQKGKPTVLSPCGRKLYKDMKRLSGVA
jgi:hypothetical protein